MTTLENIGAFEVVGRLGAGGMGEVYAGRHVGTGQPVAIKVVTTAHDSAALRRFRREVEAQARVEHPNVVRLFDYGTLGHGSGGGQPFIVMEQARGGLDPQRIRDWPQLRRILLDVLAGLAHAHARGIIHRDIKPDNILRFDSDHGGVWKLADFGIARASDAMEKLSEDTLASFSGTPAYMAPEQILGQWRRQGPATDLYAVGCMVWELVSGTPIFAGTPFEVVQKHLGHSRPATRPRFPVPADFDSWLARLIAPNMRDRFQRAREAIQGMPAPATWDETGTPQKTTHEIVAPETLRNIVVRDDSPDLPIEPTASDAPRPTNVQVPADWRTLQYEHTAHSHYRLLAMREHPLAARDAERDKLWATLVRAQNTESVRVAMVVGEPGMGKSRLADWLTTSAHDLAAAQVIAIRSHENEPSEGLHDVFRTWRLDRARLFESIRDGLPAHPDPLYDRDTDARALTEYLLPSSGSEDGPSFVFQSREQRLWLLRRTLQRFAAERPVVLWLDDLQWGHDSQALLELLVRADPFPLTVVATVRADAFPQDSVASGRLPRLVEMPNVMRIDVGPLSDTNLKAMLDSIVPLSPAALEDVRRRSEGNPLFAVQLVTDAVERGRVVEQPDGRIGFGGAEALPDDIHAVWLSRVQLALAELPDRQRECGIALELSACLGRNVDAVLLAALLDEAKLSVPDRFAGLCARRGLLQRTDAGWAFCHGMLVDSLQRIAADGGRLRAHHATCATVLARLGRDPRTIAYHWHQAGRLDEAVDALGDYVEALVDAGRIAESLDELARRRRWLQDLGADTKSERWLENEIEWHRSSLMSGRPAPEIADKLDSILDALDEGAAPHIITRFWTVKAMLHESLGQLDDAIDALNERASWAQQSADAGEHLRALLRLFSLRFHRGESGLETMLDELDARSEDLGDPLLRCHVVLRRAMLELHEGDSDRAEARLAGLVEETKRLGAMFLEARTLGLLAEAARNRGAFDEAVSHTRRSLAIAERIGNRSARIPLFVGLALIHAHAGDFDALESTLEDLRGAIDSSAMALYAPYLEATTLVLEAARGQTEAARRRVENWRDDIVRHISNTAELVSVLELARAHAPEVGSVWDAIRKVGKEPN